MRPTNDPARERYRAAVKPLLDELSAAGFRVHQLPELRRHGARAESVVPALVRALESAQEPELVEELARVLAGSTVAAIAGYLLLRAALPAAAPIESDNP